MTEEALDLRHRACRAWEVARPAVDIDPDSSASRAYFAAFQAISAYFALEGKDFSKHSALEAAVHRDLVKPGLWDKSLGRDFSWLVSVWDMGMGHGDGVACSALRRTRKLPFPHAR